MTPPRPPLRLPPLAALRTFEAAGRLQSIRQAAAELIVTPSAVSRQVRALERWLGVPLFRREARSIHLTPVGAQYFEVVSEHLGIIAAATETLTYPGRRDNSTLTVRAYTLFATNWLIPRLADLRDREPSIILDLVTSSQMDDFGKRDVDVEIRPTANLTTGYASDLLISEQIACLCSPRYLATHPLRVNSDLDRISEAELLRSATAPGYWRLWLQAAGVENKNVEAGPMFSDSSLAIQAAILGQGLVLVPPSLVRAELEDGRLMIPLPSPDAKFPFSYYFIYPKDRSHKRSLQAFRRWILAQVATG